MEERWMVWW